MRQKLNLTRIGFIDFRKLVKSALHLFHAWIPEIHLLKLVSHGQSNAAHSFHRVAAALQSRPSSIFYFNTTLHSRLNERIWKVSVLFSWIMTEHIASHNNKFVHATQNNASLRNKPCLQIYFALHTFSAVKKYKPSQEIYIFSQTRKKNELSEQLVTTTTCSNSIQFFQ